MLQFLSSYPWGYYSKHFSAKVVRPGSVISQGRQSFNALLDRRKAALFERVKGTQRSPFAHQFQQSRPGTEFARKALVDRLVNHSFEWIFVIDTPDLQIHQVDSLKYGSSGELTSRRVMELVPSVLKADLANWELLNSKLEPIEQNATPVSILLGLPQSVIKELEGWSRHFQSIVAAILPLGLVLLDQSISLNPTGFHVVLTTNHTVIALTQEGEIRLITRVDPIKRLGAAQIDAIIGSFGDTFPEMAQHPARFISSDLSGVELANEAKNFSFPSYQPVIWSFWISR